MDETGCSPAVAPVAAPTTRIPDPQALSHPALAKFWPSERRAILVHRFYLSLGRGRDVAVEEAIASWEEGSCREWRSEKMRRDGCRQLEEIERHKYHMSRRAGYDVGWEAAALDWVTKHAAEWREWWEEQPESGA
jgi:hypothetical protein